MNQRKNFVFAAAAAAVVVIYIRLSLYHISHKYIRRSSRSRRHATFRFHFISFLRIIISRSTACIMCNAQNAIDMNRISSYHIFLDKSKRERMNINLSSAFCLPRASSCYTFLMAFKSTDYTLWHCCHHRVYQLE